MTTVTARSSPHIALSVSPQSPAALVGQGEQTFLAALTSGRNEPLIALAGPAQLALRRQPLTPLAIRQLAYARLLSGQEKQGDQLLALARHATRRDFGVQLWHIEQAVERNDLDGAISGYVSTMDVLDESWGILFPRLGSAIENPEISRKLAPYVRAGGRWVVPFLNTTLARPNSELPLVRLMGLSRPMSSEVRADGFDKSLGTVLLARGKFAEARSYYLSLPYASPALLRDVAISSQAFAEKHGPFAWQLSDQLSAGAVLDGDRTISAFADDSVRAVVASKILFLTPGNYRFSQRYGEMELPQGAFVQWELQCLTADRAVKSVWRSGELRPKAGGAAQLAFSIPMACPGQRLELLIAGGIDRNRTSVIIAALKLAKTQSTLERNPQ